ncbi:MAG TPA: hypothetical protein VF084_07800 [Nitrososphaeraceae archaeon]
MTKGGAKKSVIDNNIIDDAAIADSPILLTQYSSEASQLIKSFTKYISFVVIILILIASIITFDLIRLSGFFTNVLIDTIIDTIIVAISILLIIFIIFTILPALRYHKILDKWSNLFGNNSIRTGILLSLNKKNKEEILKALSKNIEKIASPLQYYLSKSGDGIEFYDINVNDVIFDILIDKSTIKPNINSDSLKNIIQDYGNILIKLTEGTIDKNLTQSVIKSLQKYRKEGNKIGLAMIIGESITNESSYLIDKIKDKTISKSLILIEKPTINNNLVSTSDLKNLNNILTQ